MGEESTRIDDSIADWESGLPSAADLTPLSQTLIPIELASAFKIAAEQPRSMIEVNRASHTTLTSLRSPPNFTDDHLMDESDRPVDETGGSDPKRIRGTDDESVDNCEKAAAAKRPRLVWTPQLHKRFVDVVGHLGLKNAVPKTIMQLMNVEGLTRENVASHLQKYRLYVKRMQGLSNEGPSPSDHLFASTPLPPGAQSFNESSSVGGNRDGSNGGSSGGSGNNNNNSSNSHGGMQIMQMPMMGMASGGNEGGNSHYHHHHHHHHYQQQYSNMMQQQRDWSGNQYNSAYSHHVTHTNK